MKKILLAAALTACAAPVFAEPTTVLKVQGLLTNASCTPSFSEADNTINYGPIALNVLSTTDVNQIGHGNIDFTIQCASATKVSWSFTDAKASSRANIVVEDARMDGSAGVDATNARFGVGLTAGNVKIGNYGMYIDNTSVTADGNLVDAISGSSRNGVIGWSKFTTGESMSADTYNYSVATTGSVEPLAITKVTFPLVSSLAIQDTTTLALTENTDIEGQLTISLRYL